MAYHQMPPNTQLNRIKRFYRGKQKQQFGDKVQDCHDGSRLQFIKFDFMGWRSPNQIAKLWNFHSVSRYFVFLVNTSVLSSLLAIFLHIWI